MSDKQVKSERLDELADEFMEDYLLDFSNGVRHLVREAYKSGLINAEANALTEDARGASELMRLVSRTNNGDEVEFDIKGDTVFFKDLYGKKPIANLVKKRSGNYFVEGMTTDGTEFTGEQTSKREAILWAIDQWILYSYG